MNVRIESPLNVPAPTWRFCKDCRHFGNDGTPSARCNSPRVRPDLLTGEPRSMLAAHARTQSEAYMGEPVCGLGAIWFEPIEKGDAP